MPVNVAYGDISGRFIDHENDGCQRGSEMWVAGGVVVCNRTVCIDL